MRTFEDVPAARKQVPLFIGLVGPSGSGKTMSSLRLATGMQQVTGGEIFGIDSEADRMLFYADQFKFRHVRFAAPFDPLSYLAAVEHCVKRGATNIIIDSISHLHEGQGGTLETHADEVRRMAGNDEAKAERVKMAAWQKPKSELRRFLNTILQMNVNIIFNVRAKEKVKIISGRPPVALGFQPISSEELIYEMTLNCLLYPSSDGVPSWQPDEIGEKAIVKLPRQFRDIFAKREPLSEDIGRRLAEWSAGGTPAAKTAAPFVPPHVAPAAPAPPPRQTRSTPPQGTARLSNYGPAEPETIEAIKVQLGHLRWTSGRIKEWCAKYQCDWPTKLTARHAAEALRELLLHDVDDLEPEPN